MSDKAFLCIVIWSMSGCTVEVAGAVPVLHFLHTNVRHNLQVILVLFQVFLEIF